MSDTNWTQFINWPVSVPARNMTGDELSAIIRNHARDMEAAAQITHADPIGESPLAKPPRVALLEEATRITSHDRNAAYGNPEDNFQNIANFWNTYLTTLPGQGNILPLTSQDIAHLMILMKIARLNTNASHRDSLVDIAGYAACAEDCRVKRISEVNHVSPR